VTKAHQEEVTVRFIERWPDHEPREQDPHYALFNAAKRRMKRQGLLKCAVASSYHWGPIELHHDKVEFAHINDVDVGKFNALYGLHLDDEGFRVFVEQEGNLEPLCQLHHRGQEGVHSLPEPQWRVLRVARSPQNVLMAVSNTGIGVQTDPDLPPLAA
jgi:hypothetical protein